MQQQYVFCYNFVIRQNGLSLISNNHNKFHIIPLLFRAIVAYIQSINHYQYINKIENEISYCFPNLWILKHVHTKREIKGGDTKIYLFFFSGFFFLNNRNAPGITS